MVLDFWSYKANKIFQGYTYAVWLGLSDLQNQGQFASLSDARKPRYSNWSKGEPNNIKNEDCALYGFPKRGWNDFYCTGKVNYVCKNKEHL